MNCIANYIANNIRIEKGGSACGAFGGTETDYSQQYHKTAYSRWPYTVGAGRKTELFR